MSNATHGQESNPFKLLLDTKDLWLPALSWIIGQLSASKSGIKIDEWVKTKLKWIKDPEAIKAFHTSFTSAIERYEKENGQSPSAIAVAHVLMHTATKDVTGLDRSVILQQIFSPHSEAEALTSIVKRYSFAIEGVVIDVGEITYELQRIIKDYLKPEFMANSFFTDRVGFAEIIGLLGEIKNAIIVTQPDLESLRKDYLQKMVSKYENITMQGISPKVQNRTVGIRMEDLFIQLNAIPEIPKIGFSRSVIEHLAENILINFPNQVSLNQEVERLLEQSVKFEPLKIKNVSLLFNEIYGIPFHEPKEELDLLVESGQLLFTVEFKDFLNRSFFKGISIALNNLLNLPKIVIKGDPGSGKSTITRYICWAIASGKAQLIGKNVASLLPIRIRAIEFGDALRKGQVDGLEEYIMKVAERFAPLFKQSLVVGKTLVLIDGLDEVGEPSLQMKVKEQVDDFLADPVFSDNNMILTTRIVGYEPSGITGQFPHFLLSELDDEQISNFIENWYRAIDAEMPSEINVADEKKQLMEAVFENEGIHRMARNPLLITIIALIKWQGRLLPDLRVQLYDAAAQTLIRSWPLMQRQVEIDEFLVREWLAPIALHIMENRSSDLLDEFTLMEDLTVSMLNLRSMSEFDARRASRDLLESITLHSGIFLPRGTDPDGRNLYGFLHQTFAEYFSAYCLSGRWEDGKLNLGDLAHDPYWREVLLLIAGQLGTNRRAKAGQLIKAIRNLNSSNYENYIHRDLLLAIKILEDGVPVGPGDLVEGLLAELLELWMTTPIVALKADIEKTIAGLKGTEYLNVFIRLTSEKGLSDEQVIRVSRLIGAKYFTHKLVKLLEADDQEIQLTSASELLESGDDRGVNVLVSLLDSPSYLSLRAANALIMNGDPRGVKTHLENRNIVQYGTQDPFFLLIPRLLEKYPLLEDKIIELLSDSNPQICLQAATLLLERHQDIVLKVLEKLLISDESRIRLKAASLLFEVDSERTIETFINLLEDKDPWIQCQSGIFLVKHKDERGVDKLIKIEPPLLRYDAAVTLFKVKNPHGLEMMLNLLKDEDLDIRVKAAIFLAKEKNVDGVKTLIELLDTENPQVCFKAAEALANQKDLKGYAKVIKLLEADDLEIQLLAAEFLSERQDTQCINTLLSFISTGKPPHRFRAAKALLELEHPQASNVIQKELPKMMGDHGTEFLLFDNVSSLAYQYLQDHLTPSGDILLPKKSKKSRRNPVKKKNAFN
jgi:HEAT repeat protein